MENKDRRALEVAINERKKFVQKIVTFAKTLLHEHGRETFYRQYSDHTRQKRFVEFGDFCFESDDGQNMFGLSVLEIRKLSEKNRPSIVFLTIKYHGVFDINDSHCQVSYFRQNSDWPTLLLDQIENKDEVLNKMKAMAKNNLKTAGELLTEAKRLGIG